MKTGIEGRHLTAIAGLVLLVLALFSSWSTWRFVRGAQRLDGRVFFSDGSSTLVVECEPARGGKDYVLVRRPMFGPPVAGKPVSILVNPSIARDPLHPEHYTPIPVTGRVASSAYLWAWPATLLVLALTILALWCLSLLRPRRFRISTRVEFGTRL